MRSIVLASASPRRRAFIDSLGVTFGIDPADIDEESLVGASPAETALIRARAKADRVAGRHPGSWVLAGDTVVAAADGSLVGSPSTPAEAREALQRLLGTTHVVHSAAVLRRDGEIRETVAGATVRLRRADDDEIDSYVAGGEPLGKAGGLCVQGDGARFVEGIEGDVDIVIGLPLAWVSEQLARVTMDPS